MAESSEVDADLVRPARPRQAGAERVPAEPFLRLDARLRLARALLVLFRDPHAPSASHRERQIDALFLGEVAAGQRQIGLLRAPALERLIQGAVRGAGGGEQDDS